MKTHRATALLLALLSGAAGVGHQLVWTRRLVDLLGAGSETFSKVVGAFFIGLAFGAWLSTRSFLSRVELWRRVALAEFAVALLAVPILCLPEFDLVVRALDPSLARWFLPLVLVAPPAIAMGLVVPWMIHAATDPNSRLPVWLYASNTFGGVVIVPIVLLVLLPQLGLTGASVALISLNVLVALAALMFGRGAKASASNDHSQAVGLPGIDVNEKFIAFASGFLVLALEVVLQHQLAQVTINSLFSSGTVLVLVLFSLAIAAAIAPLLARRFGVHAMFCALITTTVLVLAQPFLLLLMRPGLKILPYELTAFPYLIEVLKLGTVAVVPIIVASGLVFPLLLLRANGRARDIGLLLAWNGLGGWLGAETMQAFIAPRLGLWTSMTLLAAGYGIVSLLRNTSSLPARQRIAFSIGLIVAICAAGFAAQKLPQANISPGERLVQAEVSREGLVATVECGPGDWRILFNNSYTLGGSRAQFNQERQAHLPLLLHGQARRVACLGVATGSTVAGAALHSSVEQIDAIELSPAVIAHARQFFAPYNRNVLASPRVNVIENDARFVIAQRAAAYDVVIGDLFLPWRTGEARLFALEHFRNVRRALKADGLYCQWLPLFQLTRPQFECIARTFQQIFPDAFLVRGDFYSELPIIGLVGGRGLTRVDWANVSNSCATLRLNPDVSDPLVRHPEGVAMMVLGPLPAPSTGPVNTLGNAWLEWNAGKNILGLSTPWFIGIPQAEFARDLQRGGGAVIPESLRAAHDAGQFFLTLEIASKLSLPVASQLESQVSERLPPSLRSDHSADWRQWPMRIKPQFGGR